MRSPRHRSPRRSGTSPAAAAAAGRAVAAQAPNSRCCLHRRPGPNKARVPWMPQQALALKRPFQCIHAIVSPPWPRSGCCDRRPRPSATRADPPPPFKPVDQPLSLVRKMPLFCLDTICDSLISERTKTIAEKQIQLQRKRTKREVFIGPGLRSRVRGRSSHESRRGARACVGGVVCERPARPAVGPLPGCSGASTRHGTLTARPLARQVGYTALLELYSPAHHTGASADAKPARRDRCWVIGAPLAG